MSHDVRNPDVLIAFGDTLRKIRTDKGMTQEELAYKANIAFSSVARIETGKLNTTISTVAVLADALGVEKSELMMF